MWAAAAVESGPMGVVRRHEHVVHLGQRGDLLDLGDAARVAEVGLDHVYQLARQQRRVLPLAEVALAGCQVDAQLAGGLADRPKRLDVFGRHRLLEEGDLAILDGVQLANGLGRTALAVVVYHQVHVPPDGLAQDGDAFAQERRVLIVSHMLIRCPRAGFQSSKAGRQQSFLPHLTQSRSGLVDTDVRIEANAVARGTAQQVIDRRAVMLAFDVPQGLVYA